MALIVINQDDFCADTSLFTGDNVTFASITSQLEPNELIKDQPDVDRREHQAAPRCDCGGTPASLRLVRAEYTRSTTDCG